MSTMKPASIRVVVFSIAVLMLAAPFGWSQEPNGKLMVPDEAAQKETAKLIEEIYGDDIAEVKKSAEKVALARKLLEAGRETNDDVAGKYGLFRLALEMSSSIGNVDMALEAIGELETAFQVDALAMKVEALESIAKIAMPAEKRKPLALAATEIIDVAVAADNYDAAEKLASVAVVAARKSRDLGLARQAVQRVEEIKALHAEFQKVHKAMGVLENDPTNAAANLTVGKYQCFVKGDWGDGLPMLALGNDPALKDLAEHEFSEPDAPRAQMKLGDRWWDLADQQNQPTKRRMRERAAYWYSEASPALTGLAKAKVEKRMKEVPATTAPSPEMPSPPSPSPSVPPEIPKDAVRFGGSYYKYFEQPIVWRNAEVTCENMGGQLACIESAAEQQFISTQLALPRTKSIWVGGTDVQQEGTWVWVNGAPFRYTNWVPNQPSNRNAEEHHLQLAVEENLKWNDAPESQHRPFICEWTKTTLRRARQLMPANRRARVHVPSRSHQFEPLKEGMVIFERYKLTNIPAFLASGFLVHKSGNVFRFNSTHFRILRDGKVYLLMSGESGSGGNLSGDWKPYVISADRLAVEGWSTVAQVHVGGNPCTIFERHCHKGESFTYSWHKYAPPVVIVPAN